MKVSGGGSGQYRNKGGDNSIQEFGDESGESELQQAAETLHAFYIARAEEDWQEACSYLGETMTHMFEQFASRNPELKDGGCPATLAAFTRPVPPYVTREITAIDARSLRREGDRGFIIFARSDGTAYTLPLQEENGVWKLAGIGETPIN